jgi:hypothetical protein
LIVRLPACASLRRVNFGRHAQRDSLAKIIGCCDLK